MRAKYTNRNSKKQTGRSVRAISAILKQNQINLCPATIASNLLKGQESLLRVLAVSYFGLDANEASSGFKLLSSCEVIDDVLEDILFSIFRDMSEQEFEDFLNCNSRKQ